MRRKNKKTRNVIPRLSLVTFPPHVLEAYDNEGNKRSRVDTRNDNLDLRLDIQRHNHSIHNVFCIFNSFWNLQ